MSQKKLLQFVVVGVGNNEECLDVQVSREYVPALKYLSLFSHSIVFFRELSGNVVYEEALQNISIDEKNGKCLFERLSCSYKSVEILDIKPYFPCEDRIPEISACKGVVPSIVTTDGEPCGQVEKYRGGTFLKMGEKLALNGMQAGSYLKVYWCFDKFDKPVYRRVTECEPPYEDAPRTGVFASRSPVRPNPIALTTVKVISVDEESGVVQVSDMDCFDKTPIIGFANYDSFADRKEGVTVPQWLEHWPACIVLKKYEKSVELKASSMERFHKYCVPDEMPLMKNEIGISSESVENKQAITIIGARQNNLKNVSVSIPHNSISVVTGVSGSGKSSLVFDTIYAESVYRFSENVAQSTGQKISHPEYDKISGLMPAIAVSQRNVSRNPHSTFGTTTGMYDMLRSLFAVIGVRHCPECGQAIVPMSSDYIIETLLFSREGISLIINPFGISTEEVKLLNDKSERFRLSLKEAVCNGLKRGKGCIEVVVNGDERFLFQTTQMCYICNHTFFELTPATFSFNNPESCCPVCNGIGEIAEIDPMLIVSHPELSILDGASTFWGDLRKFRKAPNANWMRGEVLALAQSMNVDLEKPWEQLCDDFKYKALYGSEGEKVRFSYKNDNGRLGEIERPVEGAVNILKRLLASGKGSDRIVELYTQQHICPSCHGERLNEEGRIVTVAGKRISEVVNMSVLELGRWIESLPSQLSASNRTLSRNILKELYQLCSNFTQAGLSYITLNRNTMTLSGGELQRTRLITQLMSGITNIAYILDEPFTGLYSMDVKKLYDVIRKLKDNGNTVVMVEHNRDVMLKADYLVDMGPGAGCFGGIVVAQGSPKEIMENMISCTGQYLSGRKEVYIEKSYKPDKDNQITLIGAYANNLKHVNITIPTRAIVCVCGVSGSGKSSLVEECLYPAVNAMITGKPEKEKLYDEIYGAECFNRIVLVDQKPIGRNSRSNPATYTGLMDEIRALFAQTKDAKQKGYKASRFSFNNAEGQCKECKGDGVKRFNVPFSSDMEIECPCCKGQQFNKETLEILYNGKNIADVLRLSVDEALNFFQDQHKLFVMLKTLHEIGLGYIKLGQSSSSISGGEAQRIKLATELCSFASGKVLYILDEPSSGLHFEDVRNLMVILQKIVTKGNTVVMVEHNEDVIRNADVVIELGPEGGAAGGEVIRQEEINR